MNSYGYWERQFAQSPAIPQTAPAAAVVNEKFAERDFAVFLKWGTDRRHDIRHRDCEIEYEGIGASS